MKKIPKPEMFELSEKSRVNGNIFIQLLIFLVVFMVIALFEGIIPSNVMNPDIIEYMATHNVFADSASKRAYLEFINELASIPKNMIITLICTIFGTAIVIIYCRFIEKRSLNSIGMYKKNALKQYGIGFIIGILLMLLVVLLNVIFGTMTFDGINKDINLKILGLYFIGFIIQGMSEEFIFRGYLMNSIGGKHSMFWAVSLSSIAFGAAHIANANITFLSILNIVLFGAFMGVYMIVTNNIWGVSAMHSMWNFAQGNIFGISVSGTGEAETIFKTSTVGDLNFIHGGGFGAEGGLITTAVILIAFIVLFAYMNKKNRQED